MNRLVMMIGVRFPLSSRNVEDLLFERGIDIIHETVRMWWNRFGPMFACDIRRQRVLRMRGMSPAPFCGAAGARCGTMPPRSWAPAGRTGSASRPISQRSREDRPVRKDRTKPWGPDDFEIQPASFVDHPKVSTLHCRRWRTMLCRAEKPDDRGAVEEWRDFDRFEADIAASCSHCAVMIPKDWHQAWGRLTLTGHAGGPQPTSRPTRYQACPHDDHRIPVYKRWQSMKNVARRQGFEIDQAWLDYPIFRAAVGAGVKTGIILMRPDRTQPFDPDNFALVTRFALKAFPTNRSHG
ncbi:hypothetical protein Q5H94_05505 [Sphingomonas sp. CA1-15]|uniref:Transposase n=1 Tax=Sphingomonas immobilis TaxID=3063997 RepID=A0ABT8ZX99_9SPHN|nr:hypothetical protein [Sphingomonas sp. CA1-15]MDO7841774.1 hypothetical protein [Sphingomonas sp. CA1-15]